MDIILKSSPAGARKLQAIIAQGPRPTEVKFYKSEPAPQELLSLPQESSKGSEYNEYNGFLKVSINNEQIIVYDGEQPDSEYAGYIDLPQFDGVKKTFLPYPSTDIDRYVYLHACYNSEKGYFVTITFARSYVSDSFWYTTLAAVSNSNPVRQIFNSNDMIYLSKDFYL